MINIGDKISTLLKAANIEVEAYWPSLFAKLAEKRSIGDLISSAAGGGAPVAVASPEKEEPKEESDDDMGFSLFD
ncbi:hypothetical protein Lal_00030965 [Lupinus albus]|nr:hypothetical protein Lal_00030965 [Lupinus albus]